MVKLKTSTSPEQGTTDFFILHTALPNIHVKLQRMFPVLQYFPSYHPSLVSFMAPITQTSTQSERGIAARKEFEEAWKDAGRVFARPQDTSAAGVTRENAPTVLYRRETSPGGTVHEYYADGNEKKPDVSTSEPITLGRRLVLGFAHPAPVESLVNMHQLYGAESDRLNATFEINDSEPEVEFLNRAGLRALPDEWGKPLIDV